MNLIIYKRLDEDTEMEKCQLYFLEDEDVEPLREDLDLVNGKIGNANGTDFKVEEAVYRLHDALFPLPTFDFEGVPEKSFNRVWIFGQIERLN